MTSQPTISRAALAQPVSTYIHTYMIDKGESPPGRRSPVNTADTDRHVTFRYRSANRASPETGDWLIISNDELIDSLIALARWIDT